MHANMHGSHEHEALLTQDLFDSHFPNQRSKEGLVSEINIREEPDEGGNITARFPEGGKGCFSFLLLIKTLGQGMP